MIEPHERPCGGRVTVVARFAGRDVTGWFRGSIDGAGALVARAAAGRRAFENAALMAILTFDARVTARQRKSGQEMVVCGTAALGRVGRRRQDAPDNQRDPDRQGDPQR